MQAIYLSTRQSHTDNGKCPELGGLSVLRNCGRLMRFLNPLVLAISQ